MPWFSNHNLNSNSKRWLSSVIFAVLNIAALVLFVFIMKTGFEPLTTHAATGIYKALNFRGTLKNSDNTSVTDGSYNFKFSIYDASSGGNCLYTARGTCGTPTAKSLTVTSGVFSTLIGDTDNSDNAITIDFNSDAYWLGVTVGTDSELTPRVRIGSSGYAFNADLLDGLNTSSNGGTTSYVPATNSYGSLTLTGVPQTSYVSSSTLYINPASATAAYGLLGLAVGGTEKFKVDSSGNVSASGTAYVAGNGTSTFAYGATFATSGGNVGIGITDTFAKLDITDSNEGNSVGMNINKNVTDPTIFASHYGISSSLNLNNSVNDSFDEYYAIQGYTNVGAGNNKNYYELQGISGSVIFSGTGTTSYTDGLSASAANAGSGTITNNVAIYGSALGAGSGPITSNYGIKISTGRSAAGTNTDDFSIYVGTPSHTGTLINHYGLYLADQAFGNNSYAIYSAGGKNYFGGNVGIGTTAPSSTLTVASSTPAIELGTGSATTTIYGNTTSTFQAGMKIISGCYLMPDGTCAGAGSSGANTALSNLASVAINASLLPGTTNLIDLGSYTKTWRDVYVSGTIYGSIATSTWYGSIATSTFYGSLATSTWYASVATTTLDGVAIGGSTAATGTFTGLIAQQTTSLNGIVNIGDNGDAIVVNSNTWDVSAGGVISNAQYSTSTWDSVNIGASTPGTGAFTNLSATGLITGSLATSTWYGSIATSTFYGSLATSTWYGSIATSTFPNITVTNLATINKSSSTLASAYQGLFVGTTATTSIYGTATSTFGAGIQATYLNITGNSATSTFANGIQLNGGCFRDNSGNCVSVSGSNAWTDGGAEIYLTTSGDNVTVGASGNLAKLTVLGDADEKQFVIKANATQNQNIFEIQNSSNAPIVWVSPTGNFGASGTIYGSIATSTWYGSIATSTFVNLTSTGLFTANNSSSTLASVYNGLYVGQTATATIINGLYTGSLATSTWYGSIATSTFYGSLATSTWYGSIATSTFPNITVTNLATINKSSSTLASAYQGLFVGTTATTSIYGTATSTFGAGIQATYLNITGNSATSTFANGIILNGGCVLVGGSCLSGSSGANTALSNLASVAINASLLPGTANNIDLGSYGKAWRNVYASGTVYANSATMEGVITTPSLTVSNGLTLTGASITGSLLPFVHNTYDIGSYTQAWKDVYASGTIYGGTGSYTISDTTSTFSKGATFAAAGGNFGVGTSTPKYKLDVYGILGGETVINNSTLNASSDISIGLAQGVNYSPIGISTNITATGTIPNLNQANVFAQQNYVYSYAQDADPATHLPNVGGVENVIFNYTPAFLVFGEYNYVNTLSSIAGASSTVGSYNSVTVKSKSGDDSYGSYNKAYYIPYNSNGAANNLYGVYAEAGKYSSTGTALNAYGGYFSGDSASTTYGVYGISSIGTGGEGTKYGGYFTTAGAATTNYGIYATASEGTTNWAGYFSGDVNVTATGTLAGLTNTGYTNLQGNVTLGDDANADRIIFTGRVDSNIIPVVNTNKNLGSSVAGNRWLNIYGEYITAYTLLYNPGMPADDGLGRFVCLRTGSDFALTTYATACGGSSRRIKHDIESLTSGLDIVNQLRPVSFVYNKTNEPNVGLIAEEVDEIDKKLVTYDNEGLPNGVKYLNLTAYLAKAIQELDAKVNNLASSSTSLSVSNDPSNIGPILAKNGIDMMSSSIINVASIAGIKWNIDKDGNLTTSGEIIKTIATSQGEKKFYPTYNSDPTIMLTGSGELINGEARIIFDPALSEIIEPTIPIKTSVTLTSEGAQGVYVAEKSVGDILVKEINAGKGGAIFDYIIVARRRMNNESGIMNYALGGGASSTVATAAPPPDSNFSNSLTPSAPTSTTPSAIAAASSTPVVFAPVESATSTPLINPVATDSATSTPTEPIVQTSTSTDPISQNTATSTPVAMIIDSPPL